MNLTPAQMAIAVGGGLAAVAVGGTLGFLAGHADNPVDEDDNLTTLLGPVGLVTALAAPALAFQGGHPSFGTKVGGIAGGIAGAALFAGVVIGERSDGQPY
jgi:hypothetical protein